MSDQERKPLTEAERARIMLDCEAIHRSFYDEFYARSTLRRAILDLEAVERQRNELRAACESQLNLLTKCTRFFLESGPKPEAAEMFAVMQDASGVLGRAVEAPPATKGE